MSLDPDPVDFLPLRFFKLHSAKDDVMFNLLNKDEHYIPNMFVIYTSRS
jgi:hypothetical protein